jgi:hypothetical protein
MTPEPIAPTKVIDMRPSKCAKCQGSMTEGFIPDQGEMRRVSAWTEGAPRKSWLGVRWGKQKIEIQTWRCTRCGFLESYAAT